MSVYVFDIDGTVADLTHRLHFIKNKPKDWGAFFANAGDDSPIPSVIRVARALDLAGQVVYYFSGRSEDIRTTTLEWLTGHMLPQALNSRLYMRKHNDHREDSIVKSELLDQFFKDTGYSAADIGGFFDDRQQVVDMWRARGFKVFQVAPGNF